jgi:hypothetical protein
MLSVAALQQVYMIDEPSSYLDVRQRLKAAKVQLPLVLCPLCAYLNLAADPNQIFGHVLGNS